jgi:asparagine N-glycosylation enzyme membrane subunit Stt3
VSSRRGLAALVAVLVVGAWARLADVGRVLGTGVVVPLADGDAAYHLIRIRYAVEHFPLLPTVDRGMNWPYGAPCPWADGFDLVAAALARATGGLGHRDRTDVTAALLPVLLGLLVVWATMSLARRISRRGAGVAFAAGLVAALVPQVVVSSRFGRIDHHVAEALSMLLLAGWALARPSGCAPHRVRWEFAGAAASAFACWTFTGGPLYVALAAPVVLAAVIRERRPALVGSGAPGLLAGAALTALATLPALRQHGQLVSFQLPSLLQPLLVALAAGGLGLAVLAGRWQQQASAARRLLALAGGCLALLGLAAATVPGAARAIAAGISGWLLRRDPWLATVQEFDAIWAGGRGWIGGMTEFLGVSGVAAPLFVAAGGVQAMRRSGRRGLAFATLSAALLAMTLVQVRFGRVFGPFLAVNVALALDLLAGVALRAVRRVRLVGIATALLALVLAVADPRLRGMLRPAAPRDLPPDAEAALALRPAPGASQEDAPGVVAPWGSGHLVALLSGRPVVVNGFGTYLDEATFWQLQRVAAMDAAAFDRLMEERRIGWILAGAPFIGPEPMAPGPGGWVLAPDAMRGLPMSPLLIAGSGIPDRGVPHLAHLMPFFATSQVVPGIAFPLPWLWGYQRVPGARLTGEAAPGARVVIEVAFTERQRPHLWRAWADAERDGRWQMVVPLPTGLVRPSLRTAAEARARSGGGEGIPVTIPETAVLRGDVVRVPPLPGTPRQ